MESEQQSKYMRRLPLVAKKRHICYLPAGRSVLGKTVPKVLTTARGRRPRVLKTEGTVFSNTDRPRPANNVFIFFSLKNYFIRNLCFDFLLKQFHTVRVRFTFRSSKHVLATKVEIKFSLILELSNEGSLLYEK